MAPSTTVSLRATAVDPDRLARRERRHELLSSLAAVPLPSADDVDAMLAAFPAPRVPGQLVVHAGKVAGTSSRPGRSWYDLGAGLADGRTFTVSVGVGGIRLACQDLNRAERTAERAVSVARARADDLGQLLASEAMAPERPAGLEPAEPSHGRAVLEFSRKSRARMIEAFANLDYAPMTADPLSVPGMVTLTYPGDWLTVAPSGAAVKRHLRAFGERFARAFGRRLVGLWKLEFQERGAPHFHLYVPVPALAVDPRPGSLEAVTFEEWLSWTWADVVGHPDPEQRRRHELAGTGVDFGAASRFTDHRRLGIYFLKHSVKSGDGKEYQHTVPAAWRTPATGPGRFWGFWGLESTSRRVELDGRQWLHLRRLARRAAAARARQVAWSRARAQATTDGLRGAARNRAAFAARGRAPRTLGAGGQLTGGFVLVPDAVAWGYVLARAVREYGGRDLLEGDPLRPHEDCEHAYGLCDLLPRSTDRARALAHGFSPY